MKRLLFYILILPVILVLAGCTNLSEKNTKKKISIDNRKFAVEVAKTIEAQRKGLSGKNSIESDKGMLFVFDKKDYPQFWMQDTLIPLQVLMVDGCKIVQIIEMEVEKDPANAEMIYKSSEPADKAVELNSKTFSDNIVGQEIKELCR